MNTKSFLSLFLFFLIAVQTVKSQSLSFDNLSGNTGPSKSISWTTSSFGNGFGHRIVNIDPGELTTLNFQARHNSGSWVNSLVINSLGRVGVGIANPSYPFHVFTTTNQRARFQFSNTTADIVDYGTYADGFSNAAGLFVSGKDALVMSSQGYHLRFVTNASGPFVERMRIHANGNVGIGTTSPQFLLAVNGVIGAKEVNVTTTGWADYVFRPEYALRPLSEVEAFINKNGHLPDVPSEKEVLENGVNLLEMNIKLLEKVEELTLYVIELEKKINSIIK